MLLIRSLWGHYGFDVLPARESERTFAFRFVLLLKARHRSMILTVFLGKRF